MCKTIPPHRTVPGITKELPILQPHHRQNISVINTDKGMHANGVFPKWNVTFTEFREFRETDKSLKHELGSV